MNYSTIKWIDIANGLGVRLSLFVSGCNHKCDGCFNKETWDFNYGEPYTEELENTIVKKLNIGYIQGLSILGGEPFDPKNQETVFNLVKRVRTELPKKDIWIYTGYNYEDLVEEKIGSLSKEMLTMIDIAVDGLYIEKQKDSTLMFKGSKNQRVIDVQRSLNESKTIAISDDKVKYFKPLRN